ncbi:MAG: type III-B CRISPR module RAMP protein Cmr4, partial [Planctomycetota bacterium]
MATRKTDDATKGAVLGIHVLTALHPGSGTALGTVDLPVQRERHTQWPVIPGSTLKGILRDACRRSSRNNSETGEDESAAEGKKNDDLLAAFGPETEKAHEHAGALSFTDARILAFPVRSLKGVFAWVTCPAVLERLVRDVKLAGLDTAPSQLPDPPARDRALCGANSPLLVDGNKLVLEEFDFERSEGDTGHIAEWIAEHAID